MSPIPITITIRAGRIPVRWEVRPTVQGERVFWPQVIEGEDTVEIEDPLDLRKQLFRAFHTHTWNENAALAFLNRAGAWIAGPAVGREEWAEGTYTNVVFGRHDEINWRVRPVTLEEMRRDIKYWYELQYARRVLPKPTSPRPSDVNSFERLAFAADARLHNTLPVSLEWGKDTHAITETITVEQLLIACAWLDAAGDLDLQICAKCSTRFMWQRKRKYCLGNCAHLVAVRKHKRKLAALKKLIREHSKTSDLEILKWLQVKGLSGNPRRDKVLVRRVRAKVK